MAQTAAKSVGWRGKILQVDLTDARVWEEDLSEELISGYTGGAGINARLLYQLLRANPGVDPLSPDNPLIFGFGVLVGTTFPCASRMTITAKSPLTGIFGDSNGGGIFPARVKQAGYDHLVFRGKARKPVALLIEKGKVPELVDATDLWGLDTFEADEKIHERYGECETARIGPAGENLVRYATICNSTKRVGFNGRAGMGCVMGSKNLKAIIVKADGTVPVADNKKFDELVKRYGDIWGGPVLFTHKEYGSLMLIAQNSDQTRIKNQQVRITPEQLQLYDITDLVQKYKKGQTACYRCPVACTQTWEVTEGTYAGEKSGKLEFGHYTNMGPLLGLFDFPALIRITHLTNRMGLDCVQFGWNLAMAMECFQRDIIGSEDTGGVRLEWGNEQVISDMIMKISRREGFGDILAGSMPDAVERLGQGAREYGFHTKGQSFTYNCTQAVAMSLASSVATRGADHLKGHPFAAMIGLQEMLERIFGKDLPEGILEHGNPVGKGRVVWWSENYKMLMDCLGICFVPMVSCDVYSDPLILVEEMGEMYEAATGRSPDHLFEAAERAYQLEKCFNARLGISRKDDLRRGTRRGDDDPIHHPGMLEEYYHYRGCSADGLPTKKRLLEVGLDDAAADLERQGKLGDRECPAINELLSNEGRP